MNFIFMTLQKKNRNKSTLNFHHLRSLASDFAIEQCYVFNFVTQ